MISTKEAAAHLGVSISRLCLLLRQGRIKGATKQGRVWMIPVSRGKVPITDKRKGPRGKWTTVVEKLTRKRIHVNGHVIASNAKNNENKPVITVKVGSSDKDNIYSNDVKILGDSRVVYQPEDAMRSGAKVWIETYAKLFIAEPTFLKDQSPEKKKTPIYI